MLNVHVANMMRPHAGFTARTLPINHFDFIAAVLFVARIIMWYGSTTTPIEFFGPTCYQPIYSP